MKSTIKVVLCISLFTSTALLTLAGDQHGTGGCETGCRSFEPAIEQPYAESTTTEVESQDLAGPVSNDTNSDIVLSDEVMLFLKHWFMNFFD